MTDVNEKETAKITKDEVASGLRDMIKKYQELPQGAKLSPVTHSDLEFVLTILLASIEAV